MNGEGVVRRLRVLEPQGLGLSWSLDDVTALEESADSVVEARVTRNGCIFAGSILVKAH